MMRIVLLNGPPRAGKDTAARHLVERLAFARIGFADELKARAHLRHGLDPEPFDRFEAVKDQPLPDFGGLSPRQAYIEQSERIDKLAHGQGFYGCAWLARRARLHPASRTLVVPDSGFVPEARELIAAFGAASILLIRIHAAARGCTYAGDSRSHIDLSVDGVSAFDVKNDVPGDPARFLAMVETIVAPWVADADPLRSFAA